MRKARPVCEMKAKHEKWRLSTASQHTNPRTKECTAQSGCEAFWRHRFRASKFSCSAAALPARRRATVHAPQAPQARQPSKTIRWSIFMRRRLPNLLPSIDTDSVEEKVIPMLEWLQTELRAPPQEVIVFWCLAQPCAGHGRSGVGLLLPTNYVFCPGPVSGPTTCLPQGVNVLRCRRVHLTCFPVRTVSAPTSRWGTSKSAARRKTLNMVSTVHPRPPTPPTSPNSNDAIDGGNTVR